MNVNSLKTLFISVLIGMCITGKAQNQFNEVVETILDNNAELKRLASEIRAQHLENADANALADPEVAIGRVWGRHGVGNKLQLDVTQEIQWPWLYAQQGKASDLVTNTALAEYNAARSDLKLQVTQELMQLVYVRHQMLLVKRLSDNMSKLEEAIDNGLNGGELTIIDKKKAEMEMYCINNTMNALSAQESQIMASIQGLSSCRIDLSHISGYPVQQVYSIDEYKSMAEFSPAINVQHAIAAQETQNEKVALLSRFPTFTVGFQHQTEMGDRFNGFTLGMNLPVFQGRHARKAAIERREAASIASEGLSVKQNSEIDALYSDLLTSKKQIEDYERVFGDNKYLEYVLKAYEGGQITVLDFINEMQYYNNLSQTRLDAEYNYHKALTLLNKYVVVE